MKDWHQSETKSIHWGEQEHWDWEKEAWNKGFDPDIWKLRKMRMWKVRRYLLPPPSEGLVLSMKPRMTLNLSSTTFTSCVLGLQVCTTVRASLNPGNIWNQLESKPFTYLLFYWGLFNPSLRFFRFQGSSVYAINSFNLVSYSRPYLTLHMQLCLFHTKWYHTVGLASELVPVSLFCLVFLLCPWSLAMWLIYYLLGPLFPLFSDNAN